MLGDGSTRKLKTKGAETWGVFLFMVNELPTQPNVPDRARLLEACTSAKAVIDIWDQGSWHLSAAEVTASVTAWSRFLVLTRDFEDLEIPKKHLSMHLIFQVVDPRLRSR